MASEDKDLTEILCQKLKKIAHVEIFLLIIIPALVLIGWQFNLDTLKRVLPTLVAMNPLTAICFIGLGVALWLLYDSPVKPQRRVCAGILGAVIFLLGTAVLSRYLLHLQLSPDTLLFKSKLDVANQKPSRMAPNTAFCFIVSALIILLTDVRVKSNKYPSQYLSVLVGFISLFALIGYLYGIKSLFGVGPFIPIALHTAVCFLLVASASLCIRPQKGLMFLFVTDQTAGFMTRRLLAAAVIIPTILGYMRVLGQNAGLYNTELGVALFVVANILVFVMVVWISGGVLYRKELEVAKVKDEFLGLATHQLQTPLTGVQLYLGMLENGSRGKLNKAQHDLIKQTIQINNRESRIVHDLLNVARVDSARMILQKQPTDLEELIKDIVKEQGQTIKGRGQSIVVHAKPTVVPIDPERMRMAIENLVSNASKYTPDGGDLSASVWHAQGLATIEVTDSGVGIDPKDINKIFTKFTRLDNPLSRQRGGNGLGMYLVKKIIELHSGTISVSSSLNKGTKIIIKLPLDNSWRII